MTRVWAGPGPRAAPEGPRRWGQAFPGSCLCRGTEGSAVWKLAFLVRRESRGIGSQNPHENPLGRVSCPAAGAALALPPAQRAKPPAFSDLAEIRERHLVQGEEPS